MRKHHPGSRERRHDPYVYGADGTRLKRIDNAGSGLQTETVTFGPVEIRDFGDYVESIRIYLRADEPRDIPPIATPVSHLCGVARHEHRTSPAAGTPRSCRLQIAFRKKLYDSIDALQADLDEWLHHYNHERTHQGKMCCGRTPIETMIDGKTIWKEKFVN